jgi:hypothetical protein
MIFDSQQLLINAATIDELLGPNYESQIGQKDSTDRAALGLAAWCRSASSGDWGVFFKRISRDNHSIDRVLSRLADVRYSPDAPQPTWFVDALWTYQALTGEFGNGQFFLVDHKKNLPFEIIFYALVERAQAQVIEETAPQALALFNDCARADLRCGLLKLLSDLYAPLLYSQFVAVLKKNSPDGKLPPSAVHVGTEQFDKFIEELRTSGLSTIFAEKPVLLRLTATIVRQWIDTTIELMARIHSDIDEIKAVITHSVYSVKVQAVAGDLSDQHNFGHSVQILTV